MYKFNSVDNFIISLNVLSKLNANEKICINQAGRIAIQKENAFAGTYRWMFGENRSKSMTYLNNLINDSLDKVYDYQKSIDPIELSYKDELIKLLQNSCFGFENLKITYESDAYILSCLESIIHKINIHTTLILDA